MSEVLNYRSDCDVVVKGVNSNDVDWSWVT